MSGKKGKSQRVETAVETLLASLAYNFALISFILLPLPSSLSKFIDDMSQKIYVDRIFAVLNRLFSVVWPLCNMRSLKATDDVCCPVQHFWLSTAAFPLQPEKKRKGAGLVLIMPGPVYPRAKDESFIDSHIKRERLYSWAHTYRTARNI